MKNLFTLLFCFIAAITFAQDVNGVLVDEAGEPLIGASVLFKGTDNGTTTNYDGAFSLSGDGTSNVLEISYIGYDTQYVNIDGRTDLGTITLSEGVGLEAIVVTGTMDIVKDRNTPVAVSTITADEIQAKATGNVELPEVAKATPSVFVANTAGGFGDSEVWTRGFDQTNTAFLLNGQPINGMEDGKMYWSNWSGISDVASAVQIQRGLGASKLAISSVGGTWNFVMKATENEKGGNVFTTVGNNNYTKVGASYSTGMINDKFGVTALLSHWSGDGWGYGTQGQGQTYFLSFGYKPAEDHTINFLVTGAPQWHHQKFQFKIADHINADGEIDPRYNSNWGVYDGRIFSERRNYYHKPILNLNWDWNVSENSTLGAVLYGSFGRGGGTGGLGGSKVRTESGLIDFDATAVDTTTNYIRRSSVNNHNWFGAVVKYENQITDNINISFGTDVRRYYGDHFRQVSELFGRAGYQQKARAIYANGHFATKEYAASPWAAISNYAKRGDRIAYNNAETIAYGGLFGQVEYSNDDLSAYVQGSISRQGHQRHEYFNATGKDEDSEKIFNNGFNLKGGVNYNLNENNSVFFNTGLYSRQPFHDAIFPFYNNTVNPRTANEDIFGLELGYKYTSDIIYANVNVYRTAWNNRLSSNSLNVTSIGDAVELADGSAYTPKGSDAYELLFQDQLHMGVELDLGIEATDDLTIKAFGSVGDWKVIGDRDVQLFDGADSEPTALVKSYIDPADDQKVGGAPQTSFGLGARYDITDNFSTEVNGFYYDQLYARNGGIKLPSYFLADLNLSYKIPFDNGNVLRISSNIYNVFDQLYISKARTSNKVGDDSAGNWKGVDYSNQVTFGKTRTWNLTMKYSF